MEGGVLISRQGQVWVMSSANPILAPLLQDLPATLPGCVCVWRGGGEGRPMPGASTWTLLLASSAQLPEAAICQALGLLRKGLPEQKSIHSTSESVLGL